NSCLGATSMSIPAVTLARRRPAARSVASAHSPAPNRCRSAWLAGALGDCRATNVCRLKSEPSGAEQYNHAKTTDPEWFLRRVERLKKEYGNETRHSLHHHWRLPVTALSWGGLRGATQRLMSKRPGNTTSRQHSIVTRGTV